MTEHGTTTSNQDKQDQDHPDCPGCIGGGGCFIATAAYGSSDVVDVKTLRKFRDKFLLTNKWGKKFVKFYYKVSPPIADFIRDKKAVRFIVRCALKPVVFMANRNLKSAQYYERFENFKLNDMTGDKNGKKR